MAERVFDFQAMGDYHKQTVNLLSQQITALMAEYTSLGTARTNAEKREMLLEKDKLLPSLK